MIFANVTSVTSNFTAVFSIIATLAAIVLGFLSAKQKVTVVALEESNTAYESLHKTDKLQIDSKDAQIILLEQKSEILEKHVTQAPQINNLAVQLATQHKELMKSMGDQNRRMGEQNESIGEVAIQLGELAKAVGKERVDASK